MALAKKAAAYDLDLMRDMKIAQERFGAGLGKQIGDFLALRASGGGLSFGEYLYFGLFSHPHTDYSAYMGDNRARAAFYVANNLADWNDAEDKLNFADAISAAGLPTPHIRAVAHPERVAQGAAPLKTKDALAGFLGQCALPVFGKPIRASHGDGAVNILSRERKTLMLDGADAVLIDDLAEEIWTFAEGDGFLFQGTIRPHADIAAITGGRLATARLLVLAGPDGPTVRHGVMRLPAGENRVDNYRRAGNLAAPIDIESGVLGAARRGVGVALETLAAHPDTGAAIEGVLLPDFTAAKALACKAAGVYPNIRIQSWDVALSDHGPTLLEVNPGGNFNILQLASGRGVFDPDFRKFLEWCVNANPSAKKNPKALKEAKKLLKLK